MMNFNRLLTEDQIVREYGIPKHLQAKVFATLPPVHGAGADAKYLESVVDAHLHRVLSPRLRASPAGSFSEKAEDAMGQQWADTLSPEEHEENSVTEVLLVNEVQAAVMLGVSRRTIFALEKNGTLTSKRIGVRKLYSVRQLRAFAEGQVA